MYKRLTRFCILGVRNYFNNYSAMYTRLTRSRIRVEDELSTWGKKLF